jgi:hypothetical protein
MFEQILTILTPYLGVYMANGISKSAISKYYAIEQQVYGLEAVIGSSDSETEVHGFNCRTDMFVTKVFLTQHEGGKNTIEEAVKALRNIDEDTRVTWVNVSKQLNIRRAVVTIKHTCEC